MPVITQQTEAQRRCRETGFCYLCGGTLAGDARVCNIDHIVPRGICKFAAQGRDADHIIGANGWSPWLRVHRECHKKKNADEQSLIRYSRVMSDPSSLDGPVRDLLTVVRACQPAPTVSKGRRAMVFGAVGPLYRAVWNIVRGCHAFLYNEPLIEPVRKNVLPPVPSYSEELTDSDGCRIPSRSIEDREELSGAILRALHGESLVADPVDEIRAWNGGISYRCLWMRRSASAPGYLCLWSLECGNSSGFARDPTWVARPWHGLLETGSPPPGAALMPDIVSPE